MTGSPASRWEAQLRAVQAGGQGGKHRGSVLRSQPPWCDLILKSSGLQAFPLDRWNCSQPSHFHYSHIHIFKKTSGYRALLLQNRASAYSQHLS